MKSPRRFPLTTKVSELPTYREFFVIYSIEVYYPNGHHVPSNTWTDFNSILPVHLRRLKNIPLTATINKIFDGDAEAVFGVNRHIQHGDPLHITLSAKKWL